MKSLKSEKITIMLSTKNIKIITNIFLYRYFNDEIHITIEYKGKYYKINRYTIFGLDLFILFIIFDKDLKIARKKYKGDDFISIDIYYKNYKIGRLFDLYYYTKFCKFYDNKRKNIEIDSLYDLVNTEEIDYKKLLVDDDALRYSINLADIIWIHPGFMYDIIDYTYNERGPMIGSSVEKL